MMTNQPERAPLSIPLSPTHTLWCVLADPRYAARDHQPTGLHCAQMPAEPVYDDPSQGKTRSDEYSIDRIIEW